MNKIRSALLAEAYVSLAPIFAASLTRGARDFNVICNSSPADTDIEALIEFRGTKEEAENETRLIEAGAATVGYRLEACLVDRKETVRGLSLFDGWTENRHLLHFVYDRRPRKHPKPNLLG